MDDHRASAAYRAAMLGQSLRKLWVETGEGAGMSDLSDRPDDAAGETLPHESAALHVTGHALYTDDLVSRMRDVLHAHPVCAPHAHARVTRLDVEPAYDVPGVVRVLTADDVPGVNDAGVKHDEPLFPSEVMFLGHAVCWVLGETLEAARLGARGRRGRLRAAARAGRRDRGDRRAQLPGRPADRRARRRRGRPRGVGPRVQRGHRDGRAGALLPRDALLAGPRRRGAARCSCRAAPSTRPRRRRSWPTCSACTTTTSPCSACGWAAASAARRCSRTASPRSRHSAPSSPAVRCGCG